MSFELTDEEAQALARAFPYNTTLSPDGVTLADAAQRWRDTWEAKVGDIVHHPGLRSGWARRMEVIAIHDGDAWLLDGDGDHLTVSLSELRKGERP